MNENFIYQATNVLSTTDCVSITQLIDNNISDAVVEHHVKDNGDLLKYFKSFGQSSLPELEPYHNYISQVLNHHYNIYHNTYISPYKQDSNRINTDDILDAIKYQKFSPPGFYDWHSEQGFHPDSSRFLVWMIYLNDVVDSGSTDFYHQNISIQPTAGTLVLWPASFTHTHRGNPDLATDKYIATGWFSFPN